MQLVGDPKELVPTGRGLVCAVDSVIDVGCGFRPQTWLSCSKHICIEPHPEYYERLLQKYSRKPGYTLYNSNWRIIQAMPDQSVDTVLAVDFIEHLPKADGFTFLETAQRIARRQVVIFTPWGFYPQDFDDPNEVDFDGIAGLHWQTHKSGWRPNDFPGWNLVGCEKFHTSDGNGYPLDTPIGAFWAIKDLT